MKIAKVDTKPRRLSNFAKNWLVFSSSLLQHHQLQLAQKPLLHVQEEVHQAQVDPISSKEKRPPQRQHRAQTELELDPEVCGDSTPTTAPESKCKFVKVFCQMESV